MINADEVTPQEIVATLIELGYTLGKDFSATPTGGLVVSSEALLDLIERDCLLMDWDKTPIFDAGVGHAP